ncbi:hypothetical protein [Caldicellulosiruptor morganii]|uniref:CRISPR-associated CXXC_CXXC protein Cst1 n=1 Tax=Caldicellulosiruptor morganii TaxID=1387555 RepID=A0ABY7BQD5_9FIRM|nr:hypothetical protein [Caldicellulosiruptor morganii]WAM33741.1 hypothetical protein OTK00_002277 [Caldicellulosiruptor morganii]
MLTLYPGNWLYNASVIGFLISVKEIENLSNHFSFKEDGSVVIDQNIFKQLKIEERYYEKKVASIIGKSSFHINYLQYGEDWKEVFRLFVKNLANIKEVDESMSCDFCGRKFAFSDTDIKDMQRKMIRCVINRHKREKNNIEKANKRQINNTNNVKNSSKEIPYSKIFKILSMKDKQIEVNYKKMKETLGKFLNGIKKFDMRHNALLAPSLGEFPNSFCNNADSLYICPLCAYLILHYHVCMTDLADGLKMFVNAPSFEVMWHLNEYVQTIYKRERISRTKELLGMSLIEMALKLNIQLGKWTMMNIEIVTLYNKKVDFFSILYETTVLLSNREIATLLNDIGELSILSFVLNNDFSKIMELGERILKISLLNYSVEKLKQNDKEFVKENIKLQKNIDNLTNLSYKLFKLYALIEEKIKREVFV